MAGYFEQYKKSEVTETNRIIHTPGEGVNFSVSMGIESF